MSNQEMQFADPDWEPTQSGQKPAGSPQSPVYTPQPLNDGRRERFQQPTLETPPQQEEVYGGYGGYAGPIPEQPRQAPNQYQRMPYRRRRRRAWLWIIIAILFISLISGGASGLGSIGQRSITQTFPISSTLGTPTIVINEPDGNIHVQRGGSLNIEEVKHSSFFEDPNNITVRVDRSGDTITMSVDAGTNFLSSRSVDFNITVPQDANLQLHTASGDISVNGTNGAMRLTTDSGDISTANDTFADNSVLSATSGDIRSTEDTFSGGASVTTTSGDIRMEQDSLNGPTEVNDSSGDITFDGTMSTSNASPATYQFNTSSGDIRIGLPANASMNVQAQTTSGSINADGFPTINVQDTNQGSGSQASGTIGTAPYSHLNLGTNSGDITIHQN